MQRMQYDGCEFNTEPQKNQVKARPKPEYKGGIKIIRLNRIVGGEQG